MNDIKYKIVILISSYNIGGFETRLSRLLHEFDKNLFEITVILVRPWYKLKHHSLKNNDAIDELFNKDFVQNIVVDMRFRFDIFVIFRILKQIRLIDPYILLYFAVGPGTFIGPILGKLAAIPRLIRISGTVLNGLYPVILRPLDKLLIKWNDVIIVPTKFLKNELVNILGCLSNKIKVIYNGVEYTEKINQPSHTEIKNQLNIDPNNKIIGIIANLTPNKSHLDLIEALKLLHNDYPDTTLLIIGEGAMKEALESRVEDFGLKDNVQFLGYRSDVKSYIQIFDVGVLCSQMETMGNSLLEIMSLGVPVIGTSVGGIPEFIVHEENGLLVPPSSPQDICNAIKIYFSNPEKAKLIGMNGRETIKHNFNQLNMTQQFQDAMLGNNR